MSARTSAQQTSATLLLRMSQGILAVTMAGTALAVGAVHPATLCIATALLAAAVALGWWRVEAARVRPVATLLLFTGVALVGYTALQCAPLPESVLLVIAPHNADVWARSLAPLHEGGPRWAPLTEDPSATRVEVLKGVAYVLAFLAALRIARRREGASFLNMVLVATGVALATAALLHPAFGARRLFGLYDPSPGVAERHVAPLMNPNNLAGYLNVAFCTALASTLSPEPRVPRPITAAVALALVATQVWIASRGGLVALCLGAVIVVTMTRLARSRRRSGSATTLTIVSGAAAALGACVLSLAGSEDAATELFDSDASKVTMLGRALHMLPAVWRLGCGRGSFESAFPAFRVGSRYVTYTHPENLILQWVIEWGLPVAVGGIIAIAVALRPTVVLARSTTAVGAWAAIVALVVQNMADLGSEIPAVCIAGAVCAAIVVAGTAGNARSWRIARWSEHGQAVALVATVLALAAIAWVLPVIGDGLHDNQQKLEQAAIVRHVDRETMHGLARAAMLRHPAEPYLPFVTALRASSARDDDPLPWLEATLERAHTYGPAHLILARMLVARSRAQARFEYRLAMEQMPELEPTVVPESLFLVSSYGDASELVPAGSAGSLALEGLVVGLDPRMPATAARLDDDLAARAPGMYEPRLWVASASVFDVESGDAAPWCSAARESCIRAAGAAISEADESSHGLCAPHVLRARLRVALGEGDAALAELDTATDSVRDRVECLKELAMMAADRGADARVQRALNEITNAGCSEDAECVARLRWVGDVQQTRGNYNEALAMYKRASTLAPDDDGLLLTVAGLAARAGFHGEAAEYYERLARHQPSETKWKDAAQSERRRAIQAIPF